MSFRNRFLHSFSIRLALAAACLMVSAGSMAQVVRRTDTAIGPSTLEVIQLYRPEVKVPLKPQLSPSLPLADTSAPKVKLEVPRQTLSYSYHAIPIRPLALGQDTASQPAESYVQLGLGNLSSVLVEAGYTGAPGAYYRPAVQLRHLSQSSNARANGQQSAVTSLLGSLAWDGPVNRWRTTLAASRNQYRYYGFDRMAYALDVDTLRQTFLAARIGGELTVPGSAAPGGWQATPAVHAGYYGDVRGASELSLWGDAPFTKALSSELEARVGLAIRGARFANDDTSRWNNLGQVFAGLTWRRNAWTLGVEVRPTIGIAGRFDVLPRVAATYDIVPLKAAATLGWSADIRQNTYEELSTVNPFMLNNYTLRQTRADEVYFGVKAAAGKHLGIDARLSFWNYNDLPLFINQPFGDRKNFAVVYDDVQAFAIQGGARYAIGSQFTLGATGLFQAWFNQKTYARPWHVPTVVVKVDVAWRPWKPLLISGYLAVQNGIWARNVTTGLANKLEPVVDLGLGAEYTIIPRLAVFLKTQNLLGIRNERWLGYPGYGFNILGGARYEFGR